MSAFRRSRRSNRSPTKISAPAFRKASARASSRRTKARTGKPFFKRSSTAGAAVRPAADVTSTRGRVDDPLTPGDYTVQVRPRGRAVGSLPTSDAVTVHCRTRRMVPELASSVAVRRRAIRRLPPRTCAFGARNACGLTSPASKALFPQRHCWVGPERRSPCPSRPSCAMPGTARGG